HHRILSQKRIIAGFHRRRGSSWDLVAEEDYIITSLQKRTIVKGHHRILSQKRIIAGFHRRRGSSWDLVAEEDYIM
ncbi:hypothetical protein ALC60_13378, partial [Trachymyrmex zeteki]